MFGFGPPYSFPACENSVSTRGIRVIDVVGSSASYTVIGSVTQEHGERAASMDVVGECAAYSVAGTAAGYAATGSCAAYQVTGKSGASYTVIGSASPP